MKRLPTLLTVLAGFCLLALSACSDAELLERREDRLLGTWIFDKAFFRENGDLFRDNISGDFEGDILQFNPDYTCVYDDRLSNKVYYGTWGVFLDRDNFDGENDIEYYLDINIEDERRRPYFSFSSGIEFLTFERLTFVAQNRAGEFRFRMSKLR